MMLIKLDDITKRLPTTILPLTAEESSRVTTLIGDAEEQIRDEFSREGRDLDSEMIVDWVANAARRVARDMVSAAVIVGPNAGARSVSSTTGPQSDSMTWERRPPVRFGGVMLTDDHRAELGLSVSVHLRHRFPRARSWPEVRFR